VDELKLNFNYNASKGVASVAYYHEDVLCELMVDKHGNCDFDALDEFLTYINPNYRIEMFAVEVVQSIARQLYLAIASQKQTVLERFCDDVGEIIEADALSHVGFEALIIAREHKVHADFNSETGHEG